MQMTKIKQYVWTNTNNGLFRTGIWIKFSDHEKALYKLNKTINELIQEENKWRVVAKQKLKNKFNVSDNADKFIDEVFGGGDVDES